MDESLPTYGPEAFPLARSVRDNARRIRSIVDRRSHTKKFADLYDFQDRVMVSSLKESIRFTVEFRKDFKKTHYGWSTR